MKQLFFVATTILLALGSCQCSSKKENSEPEKEKPTGTYIEWDKSSAQMVAQGGYCGYARFNRLSDGTIMMSFNNVIVRSNDDGKTWGPREIVFPEFDVEKDGKKAHIMITNFELIELQDGTLIAGVNYRPQEPEIAPFSIVVKRSTDKGQTWSDAQYIYDAEPRFHDGCWEPSFLQLPNGEVQCYFANEKPYTNSDEQEISMLSSKDGGKSWGDFKTVCFRKDRRDGMPVPILYKDEIRVVIEDNKIGEFKPYIVRNKISDNFKECVSGDSPLRHYALKEEQPDSVYMGAPYIVALPTGEIVMSYQTTRNRTSDWELSTMEVAVSDKNGENFTNLSQPFEVPLGREAKWNSVALWDENHVVAVASTNFAGREIEVWIIKGKIVRQN